MDRAERKHIIRCLLLVGGIYVLCRALNLTGPQSYVPFETGLIYPAIAAITAWGLWRLLKRK